MAKRSWKVRMGKLLRVPNQARKFGANDSYLLTKVQFPNGSERYVLFTDHQLEVALDRAAKNPEDVTKTTWIQDVFD